MLARVLSGHGLAEKGDDLAGKAMEEGEVTAAAVIVFIVKPGKIVETN